MNTKRFRATSILLSSILASSLLFVAPDARSETIGEAECYPAVLLLRGSGEQKVVSDKSESERSNYPKDSNDANALISANGYEGSKLSELLEEVTKQPDIQTISRLRFIGVDYSALAVAPTISAPPSTHNLASPDASGILNAWIAQSSVETVKHYLNYSDSINEGAKNVKTIIDQDMARGCDTQYLIAGYSQGALSARLAVSLVDNPDKIIGTYLVGDPHEKGGAADISKGQRSIASTGWDRDGLTRRVAPNLNFVLDPPNATLFPNPLELVKPFLNKFDEAYSNSDSTIYRSDEIMTSRALCHEKDSVCWTPFPLTEPAQHTNYFDELTPEGLLDLAEEAPAFSSQLAKLANSQTANPRERSITKTLSVKGKPTDYFIANSRVDDVCSWDKGSDGTFEVINGTCNEYRATNTGSTVKMTVKVKDSFGVVHTYVSEEPVIDPEMLNTLVDIPRDKWLRFESFEGNKCVTIPQQFEEPSDFGPYGKEIEVKDCNQSPSSNYTFDATQVFKRTDVNKHKNDYYVSGYDKDYYIESSNDFSAYEVDVYSFLGLKNESNLNPTFSGLKPSLVQIRDGINYYQLKAYWGSREGCFTKNKSKLDQNNLAPCDWTDNNQLFKPILAPESEKYGELSLEQDTSPPTEPENFKIEYLVGPLIRLSWNPSIDERTDQVASYTIEYYDSTYDEWIQDWDFTFSFTNEPPTSYETPGHWAITKYRIKSADYAGNHSDWVEISMNTE